MSNNGCVAGNIIDNACLTFANPLAETYSSTISGTGRLTQAGPGTLILGGANAYTGPTAVMAGTLALLPAQATVLHYTFDTSSMSGLTAGSTVTDVSGNGHTGTIYGSPTRTTGRFGQALTFASGPNVYGTYVEASPSPAFNVDNYTVSAWINIPSTAASSGRGRVHRQHTAQFGRLGF